MRKIHRIILHCSATKPDHDVTMDDLRTWHVDGNGWKDVGYHYSIRLDGTLEVGRPVQKVGAGVKGHNTDTVHVCYIGGLDDTGKPANTLNDDQRATLYTVCTSLVRVFGPLELMGHNDLTDEKECPSFRVSTELAELVQWCTAPDGNAPQPGANKGGPETVAPRKYCRRCNRRFRM